MNPRIIIPSILVSITIVALSVFWLRFKTGTLPDIALVGAKIYKSPYDAPISNGTVLIKDGKILCVGESSEIQFQPETPTIDCSGLVMTSGFWNSHVHFMEEKWSAADKLHHDLLTQQMQEMFTQYGFTYVFDLATLAPENLTAIRNRITSGDVKGPRIFFTGIPIAPRDASPFYIAPLKLAEPETTAECMQHVSTQFALGADAIKVWSASPTGKHVIPMPIEFLMAVSGAAHQQRKLVFAHPSNLEGTRLAVEGGVDILAHVAGDDLKNWDSETLKAMLSSNVALIPTLKLHKWDLERFDMYSREHPLMETALLQVGMYHNAGGEILFGTDVGYMTDYSPEDEYILLHEAGLTFLDILETLTTNPTDRFGLNDQTGRIAPGVDGDLVLLTADPVRCCKFC